MTVNLCDARDPASDRSFAFIRILQISCQLIAWPVKGLRVEIDSNEGLNCEMWLVEKKADSLQMYICFAILCCFNSSKLLIVTAEEIIDVLLYECNIIAK